MTPKRPYLIRALYEWIIDNGFTPYVLVDANFKGVAAPQKFIQDGKIIFNISMNATQKLIVSNDAIEFDARFNNAVMHIFLPILSVLAIYAKENGEGMMFAEEAEESEPQENENQPSQINQDSNSEDDSTPTPPKGKPNLRIVK